MVPGRADEPATSSPEDGVPPARLAQLSRGVNLGAWFCWYKGPQPAKYDHAYLENHLTPADFDAIKKAGFTFVRFPVNYELFLDEDHPDALRPEFLGDLDFALDRLFAAGLAVDIDWHATDETWARLRDDDAFAAKAEIFMGAVAKHLSRRDPERLFLETVNEPIKGVTNKRWEPIQDKMLRLMRANAPAHTLIAEGVDFSNIDGLVQLKPVAVGNIVYNFHFYTWIFTHQGSWEKRIHDLVGLDYPVNEANKAQVVARMSDPEGRKWAAKFHETRQTLTAEIGQAVAWGQRYHVPLLCNEFGVFKHGATEPSRLRWIRDVREILEADHIGWCIWTYDDSSFGITDPDKSGRNILEPATLKALGLESGPAQ
jgi:endoglucanase